MIRRNQALGNDLMDVYEIESGRYQVDTKSASFVFGRSRFDGTGVEIFECYPESARSDAKQVLIEARKHGLPI